MTCLRPYVRRSTFIPVDTVDEVLAAALEPPTQ